MTAPRANSPTSPATRDRIAVDAVNIEAQKLMFAEADRTGRTVAALAAEWLDQYQPPARRVLAVVEIDDEGWWTSSLPGAGRWSLPLQALLGTRSRFDEKRAIRIEPAGPTRYELVEDA